MYDNRNVLKLIMYTKGLLKMKGGKVRYIDSVFSEMFDKQSIKITVQTKITFI